MDAEIKTLVYRDRAEITKQKQSKISQKFHRLSRLNRLLTITAVSLLVLASTTGVMAGIAFSDEAENAVLMTSAADIAVAEVTTNFSDNNGTDESDNENSGRITEDGIMTASSAISEGDNASDNEISATAHPGLQDEVNFANVTYTASIEENIILQLLSNATGEEEDEFIYIPPTLGLDDDAEEEETFTRLDEIAEEAEKYIAPEGSPSSLVYKYNPKMMLNLSNHEIEVLERIVEAEATGMDVYGKMLVANVVINRVHSKYFANDVESVVFQKIGGSYQFAPIKDGRYKSVKVTSLSKEAVRRVLDGEDYSQGALYFFQRSSTSKSKATWFDKNLKYLFKYGAHEFFTEWK